MEVSTRPRAGAVLVATAIGLVFGGGDQLLGSFPALSLGSALSLTSAPWLVLAFLLGARQDGARSGAILGLIGTLAALVGYFAMTLSPLENVNVLAHPHAVIALVTSERLVIVGGLLCAPIYGALGSLWRSRRLVVAAAAASGALLLEPAARVVFPLARGALGADLAEVASGVVLLCYFVWARRARREVASRA